MRAGAHNACGRGHVGFQMRGVSALGGFSAWLPPGRHLPFKRVIRGAPRKLRCHHLWRLDRLFALLTEQRRELAGYFLEDQPVLFTERVRCVTVDVDLAEDIAELGDGNDDLGARFQTASEVT